MSPCVQQSPKHRLRVVRGLAETANSRKRSSSDRVIEHYIVSRGCAMASQASRPAGCRAGPKAKASRRRHIRCQRDAKVVCAPQSYRGWQLRAPESVKQGGRQRIDGWVRHGRAQEQAENRHVKDANGIETGYKLLIKAYQHTENDKRGHPTPFYS